MRRKKLFLGYVVILSLIVFGLACKSKKKEQSFVAPNYIKVSFISIGSGTDGATRKLFLDFLAAYQTEQKISLEINSWNWGREGEKDYCIATSTLPKDKYLNLQEQLNNILDKKELVRMSYPESCSK